MLLLAMMLFVMLLLLLLMMLLLILIMLLMLGCCREGGPSLLPSGILGELRIQLDLCQRDRVQGIFEAGAGLCR